MHSIFWAITIVTGTSREYIGYPETIAETLMTLFALVIGIGTSLVVMGTVISAIEHFDELTKKRQFRINSINAYLRLKQIPRKLQGIVRQYYDYKWLENATMEEDPIHDLHPSIKTEVTQFLFRELISGSPLFQGCKTTTIPAILQILERRIFLPQASAAYSHVGTYTATMEARHRTRGIASHEHCCVPCCVLQEYVIVKGEIGNALFIIDRGSCEVLGTDVGHLVVHRGQSFGESALFTRAPRAADVRSVGFSELLILKREDFEGLCLTNTDFMISAWSQTPGMVDVTKWDLVRWLFRLFLIMRNVGIVCSFARLCRMWQSVRVRQQNAEVTAGRTAAAIEAEEDRSVSRRSRGKGIGEEDSPPRGHRKLKTPRRMTVSSGFVSISGIADLSASTSSPNRHSRVPV